MSKTITTGLTGSGKTNTAATRPDFAAIKKTTDIVRVVESYGIALRKVGKEFVGLCPFHKDVKTPNLHVNREKGVFHCKVCGEAGNAIQFVARKEGISEREAALKLCTQIPGVRRAASTGSGQAEAPPPSSPQPSPIPDAERASLLKRVAAFYAKTLARDRAGLDYLKTRNLADPAMLEHFQAGYCNGTLHQALPKSGSIIEGLKALGILDKAGREILRGRITVPILDAAGNVSGFYARNAQPCEKGERHRYLAGSHRGVFNGACAKSTQTLIITEAILDAMALWQAGFRNAVALYGTGGWTGDHEALFRENGTTEVYLALDNNDAGRKATERLKGKLSALVKTVHVIAWPEGVTDAADFFLSRTADDFEPLIRAAHPPETDKPTEAGEADTTPRSEVTQRLGEEKIEMTPEGFIAGYGARRYELRAIERASAARMKATVKVLGSEPGRFHIDTVDFYLSRSRRGFIIEAARLFREEVDVIESDVNRLTLQLESYAAKLLTEKAPRAALLSEGDQIEGRKLGENTDLVAEILTDVERLGMVGEKVNALAGYIVMTSRKMEDPLSLLVLSGSGAGKSHFQDTILSLCPEEDLVKVTSLSNCALFYKGEDSLKHKVLAIEEEAGAQGADYAIRNLISSKKLVKEATIKNPLTGKMETQTNRVNGPASVFKTTTNPEADAETRSRFLITSVDESSEQTRAILAAQRNAHTLEGMRQRHRRVAVLARHHAFQRMLRPLAVVNPYEPFLTYGDDRLLVRRDNPKYQHLILAVTFLRQMRREVKRDAETGREYIEATLEDIATANDIARELLAVSLDDLSAPGRQLLKLITDFVRRRAAQDKTAVERVEFGRRELREAIRWTEARLRLHLAELVRLEYILPTAGRWGKPFGYVLAVAPEAVEDGARMVAGLKTVDELRKAAKSAHFASENTHFAGTSQPRSCEVKNGCFPSENGNGNGHFATPGGLHVRGKNGVNGSIITKGNGAVS